jgi:hypothetical protein
MVKAAAGFEQTAALSLLAKEMPGHQNLNI